MVSECRQEMVLQIVKERHSVTVTELTELLGISESTARRDIVQMDKEGRLVKVYGGAVLPDDMSFSEEPTVAQKTEVYIKEKRQIARYAASMIKPHDFVYLDAGTTTGYMLDYIEESRAAFVTNAVAHAQKLAAKGDACFSDRRDAESIYRSGCRGSGRSHDPAVSFFQRIFRGEWDQRRFRFYNTG